MTSPSNRQGWGARFRCAFRGICEVAAAEPSARFQWSFMGAVLLMAWWLHITAVEWAVVLLCCGAVTGAEALNTAIEKLADRVTTEREESIRRIKDAAAAGVLLITLGASAAGSVILLPRLVARLWE